MELDGQQRLTETGGGGELVVPPSNELRHLTLAERVVLEDALGEAQGIVRELNDAEIRQLHEAGASQRAIAEAMGVSKTAARNRLVRLGVVTPDQPFPQMGDTVDGDAEELEDVGTLSREVEELWQGQNGEVADTHPDQETFEDRGEAPAPRLNRQKVIRSFRRRRRRDVRTLIEDGMTEYGVATALGVEAEVVIADLQHDG